MPKKSKSTPVVIILSLFLLILLSVIVYNYSCVEGFESTPNTFEADLTGGKKLVLFYASWCGYCTSMKGDWDNAAKKVNQNDKKMIKINVGENNQEQKKIAEKYSVSGYPTILVLNNGVVETSYEGELNEASFVKYVNNHLVN